MKALSAADEVLLAACKLTDKGTPEFTEWQLTVETWLLNKNRWGLRGFEDQYPDHKRVMNEVMATGTQKVVGRGLLERTRPNHYRVTSNGLAAAAEMSGANVDTRERTVHIYDSVRPLAFHRVFEAYLSDPSEPKTWLGVAAFLGLTENDPDQLDRRLKSINDAIARAKEWLDGTGGGVLKRGDTGQAVTRERITKLGAFVAGLETRFSRQYSAIRAKRRT